MRSQLVLAVAALGLLTGACSAQPDAGSSASASAGADGVKVTVMTFNIEYGGDSVDFSSVPKAIKASGAQVVAIEEAYAQLPKIAAALGWDYYDPRTQVLSQYPLISPGGGPDAPVYVEVQPGRYLAVFDVHLDSSRYGPNGAAAGQSKQQVLARESTRAAQMAPIAAAAGELSARGVPTVVMGDFNSPSFQDWTSKTVGLRDQIKYPVRWPATTELSDAGLVDLYRVQYPDPVTDPGLTWPAARPRVPGYNPARRGAPADRIDMIWAGQGVTADKVQVVGEKGADAVSVDVTPWPSDHRAVVADLTFTPGSVGPVVAPQRRVVDRGDDVTVDYSSGPVQAARVVVSSQPQVVVDVDDPTYGTVTFPTLALPPATYTVSLQDDAGRVLASSELTVLAPGAPPTLTTGRSTYLPGEGIRVTWTGAPGNKWDWVGVYWRGVRPATGSYKVYRYTGATVDGSTVLNGGANAYVWPLKPGDYSVYLLLDDSYLKVAQADFTVKSPKRKGR